MKLAKIGHTLAHFAPAAAAILTGGAAGPVAAAVTKEVTSALGVHHESTPEEIDKAVAEADPAQIAKLRQIEADVQKDAQAASVKMAEIAAGDRDSARKREIALHDATPAILTFCVTGSLIGCILLLVFKGSGLDVAVLAAVSSLAGALASGMHTILTYYFGGSKGSDASAAVLHKIAQEGTKQ